MIRREQGQTLIIALIILGLLLILGFVFLGIVDRNIRGGANARTRSQANDLAEAGIRFAQQQLVNSPAGADWRGSPTQLTAVGASAPQSNYTRDPDAFYLRPASYVVLPGTANQKDLGGPDGLGPYVRINYDRGRSLVRVRYGPSDANILSNSPIGPLRNPGQVRNYLIVESIGRQGVINTNDPTTLAQANGVQFQGYASTAELQSALSAMRQFDSQVPNSRHLLAFATTGLIDNARYITNKYSVNRPADIGVPNPYVASGPNQAAEVLPGLGAVYNQIDVGSLLSYQLGANQSTPAPTTPPSAPPGGGSLRSNADVTFHGNVGFNLIQTFGEKVAIAGNIVGDTNSSLTLNASNYNGATWNTQTGVVGPGAFQSRSSQFSTQGDLLIDGIAGVDVNGYSRGVGRLAPPSIFQIDPQTKRSRYLELTRGETSNFDVSGVNGHGNGVYVANTSDIQTPSDEAGRAGTGSTESLLYDWNNPNNGSATTGWRGPFYVPVGAYVQLLPDGFTVQLDKGTWPDQSTSVRRYRVGLVGGQLYIVDSAEDPTNINNSTGVNFGAGKPFNGVLYFEGNVRIRGEIPTDVQLTLVSGATIYIEGSITKGVIGNDITDSYATGNAYYAAYNTPIKRLSKSALMLMAKDYVAVNTTQFLGLTPGQSVQEVNDQQNDAFYNAIDLPATPGAAQGQLQFSTELLTDPTTGTPSDPSSYSPYVTEYNDAINTGTKINTKLMLAHTMSDGTVGAATLIGMNVNLGVYGGSQSASQFYFPGTQTTPPFPAIANTASDYLGTGATSINMYGLGKESWQRYDKFESRGFNIVYPGQSSYDPTSGAITSTNPATDPFVGYSVFAPGSNSFLLRPTSIVGVPTNDYLLGRAALAPSDVRIEASIYAEEGSFVVIPGPWFNPNSNDTRDNYNGRITALTGSGMNATQAKQEADQERLESFGNAPEVPFYGEPLDVRVQVFGSVSENMPPPMASQVAWMSKWGWIPVSLAATGGNIPSQHIPANTNPANVSVVPNFVVAYDPVLATGRANGYTATNDPTDLIRTDSYGRALLPMPRLPVSPALTYFGDVQ